MKTAYFSSVSVIIISGTVIGGCSRYSFCPNGAFA